MLSNQKCFLIMFDRHCKLFVLSLCFLYTQLFNKIVISTSRQTNIIINGFVGRLQQRGNNCSFCQSSIKKEPYTYRALVPAASGLAWIVASQSSFLCYQSLKLLPIPIWSTGHDLLPFSPLFAFRRISPRTAAAANHFRPCFIALLPLVVLRAYGACACGISC